MRSVAKAIRFVFNAIILFFGLTLLLAVLWTLQQVVAAYSQRQEADNAVEARQETYRATGTALASESPDAQLLGEPAIVLVQQLFTTSTPQPHTTVPVAGNAGTNRPAEVVFGCQPGGGTRTFRNSGSPSGRSDSARLQVSKHHSFGRR